MAEQKPMSLTQCQTIKDLERLDLRRYLMEPKIDGWRIQFEVTPDDVRAWTRTNHDATRKMPMVEHHLKYLAKSANAAFRLDGEAVYIDENGEPDYNFTARCLGSYTETCIEKQAEERKFLSYFVFDILRIDDQDVRILPLDRRKEILNANLSFTGNVNVVLGDQPTIDQHVENCERFKEGSVLKDITSAYAGKRHRSWLKWKVEQTVDVRITGYKPGQGKFKDLIGAIQFQADDGTTGNCSGMDDDTRVYITNNRLFLMGKTIEIKHYGRLVDSWRHPQFVRFRFDK